MSYKKVTCPKLHHTFKLIRHQFSSRQVLAVSAVSSRLPVSSSGLSQPSVLAGASPTKFSPETSNCRQVQRASSDQQPTAVFRVI
ncbi:hypothetical protein R6Q57_017683 [Mikania cordata]